jgi:hypothetical protein
VFALLPVAALTKYVAAHASGVATAPKRRDTNSQAPRPYRRKAHRFDDRKDLTDIVTLLLETNLRE